MHPDQNKVSQIFGKVTSKGQIPTFMTDLKGLVQNDIKSTGVNPGVNKEYFEELQTYLNSSLNKVSDAGLKTQLKSEITNFISTQQAGAGKSNRL
jgi:hypothetical protein